MSINFLPTHHMVEGAINIKLININPEYNTLPLETPSRSYYIEKETPENLTPMAQWLADNVPNATRNRGLFTVKVIDDTRTQGDINREQNARTRWGWGQYFSTPEQALESTEKMIRAYNLDAEPATIKDFDFPLYNGEPVSEYWEKIASHLQSQGTTRIIITDHNQNKVCYPPSSEQRT